MKLTPEQIVAFPWTSISGDLLCAMRGRILEIEASESPRDYFLCRAIRVLSRDPQAAMRFGEWLSYCEITRSGYFFSMREPSDSGWNRMPANQWRIDLLTQLIDS